MMEGSNQVQSAELPTTVSGKSISGSANGECICHNESKSSPRVSQFGITVSQAPPAVPARGRAMTRRSINRSRSCINKIVTNNMTQPVLTQWSHLFQPRRARSLDSRVSPKGAEVALLDNICPSLSLQHPSVMERSTPSEESDADVQWGDPAVPIDEGSVLRCIYQNVAHSLSVSGADPGLLNLVENWKTAQCGVALCSETNVNWRRHKYTYGVRQALQEANTVHMSTASSSMGDTEEFLNKRFLPGGAAIFTFNHWACTVVESGQDELNCGWLCYTTLQGRNKQRFTIACFYRSNKPSAGGGPTTAHAQATSVLERENIKQRNSTKIVSPREEIVRYLADKIIAWQQRGDSILLCGDGNETPDECNLKVGARKFSMSWLFEVTGLQDVFRTFHSAPPKTTTTTPRRPIDWIGIWRVPVLRVGQFDECFPAISDHLGFFVDIDIAGLMHGAYDTLKLPKLRKLTFKNVAARTTYEEFVLKQWRIHNIAERARALHERAIWHVFTEADLATLNQLDRQITEILLGAERRCSSRVVERDKWSPRIKTGGRNILYWRARLLTLTENGPISNKSLERHRRRANISLEEHHSLLSRNEIKKRLRDAWRLHRNNRNQAAILRQQHLCERAADLAERQNMQQAKAVKAIKRQEQTRQRFNRIRRANGKLKRGLIQIEVDDLEKGGLVMLTDKEAINNALLSRNELHLQEPNFTPFGMLGDLYPMVDPTHPENQVEALLAGRAELPERWRDDTEVRQWVQNLQRKDIEEIDLTVTSDDFVQYFSRRKESTASSPSDRHYGHMKVIARMEDSIVRDTLLRVAATAVAVKRPIDRWLKCTQIMLDKGKGVYINNLRIIQLLEADLNFILGFIWSKQLNRAAARANLFNTSQYALPGKTCNSAVLKKVLFFDLLRQPQQAGSIVDFDAKAAYDSILPALATVTCMRMGLPRGAGDFMTQLINNMEYSVATGLGKSTKTYNAGANPFFKCQGGMQGSTSAAPSYNIHHDVSLATYCEYGTPAVFPHPHPTGGVTEDYAAQFVDDNQQQKSMLGLKKHYEDELLQCQSAAEANDLLVRVTNEDANRWCKYSFCAGGLINASKCFWQLIQPTQCPNSGKILYATEAECPGEVILNHPDDESLADVIPRYAPDIANRTLGARLAPDGNVRAEIKSRYEKARQWSISLHKAQLSNSDRWVAYNSCVRSAVVYPLTGQQCSIEDLAKTQGVMDQIACHALGLNEHFPRALLHGPVSLGGVGVPTLWAETLADKLAYFLHHVRIEDDVGRQLKVSVAITQLEIGVGIPFFQLPFDAWGHLTTPSWVKHLWQSCSRVAVDVKAATGAHWVPPLQTAGDEYIMDRIVARYSRKACIKLNHCRRFLQLVTVSDLFLHDGRGIHPDLYRGKLASGRIPQYSWPDISAPSKSCWTLWKQFLRSEFAENRCIQMAEDVWHALPTYSHDLQCCFDGVAGNLYRCVESGWRVHEKLHAPRLRGVIAKCSLESVPIDGEPPASCVWVEVEETKEAVVILAESLREAAAMRRFEETESFDDVATDFLCLENRLQALPPELKRLVGRVELPSDGGQALVDALRNGQQLFGVSDGSAAGGAATHGWKLARRPRDQASIQGSGPVDGRNPTPFRAEMQGQLAILIVSSLLVANRGIPKARIISLCDNKATLRRMAEHSKSLHVRDHLDSEVDLFLIYRTWMRKNYIQPVGRWVKGHQDRNKPMHEIADDGLLNIEVDNLATRAYGRKGTGCSESLDTVFPEEVYGVLIDGSKVTAKLKQHVIDRCGEDSLRQYLLHKHRLSEGKMEGINWAALASYLRSLSPPRRATQVKLQHEWIPTNSFLYRQQRTQSAKCPLCHTDEETAAHVRRCKAPVAQTFRNERCGQLLRELRGINTAPEIIQCWEAQLRIMSGDDALSGVEGIFCGPSDLRKCIGDARRHQAVLSWEGLLQGRVSVIWSRAQAIHERCRRQESASHRKQRPWEIQVIRLLCEYNGALWGFRNDEVHGRTLQEEQAKLRAAVELKVRNLYARFPELLPRYPSIYSVPLEVRLRKPTLTLQMWVKQVLRQEYLTDIARQKAMMQKGSIERFLRPRQSLQVERRGEQFLGLNRGWISARNISRWWRRRLRYQSKVEMPRMGIGDPG